MKPNVWAFYDKYSFLIKLEEFLSMDPLTSPYLDADSPIFKKNRGSFVISRVCGHSTLDLRSMAGKVLK